ncbi:MAG: MarR family transcriptional regulator [Lachnospiraceae bacterium]|nr:MarR family transcriptional regulator [Lachnospiraceae bacterium]
MNKSLAYYVSILRREFVSSCNHQLQLYDLSVGLVYPILYIGNHPGCSPKNVILALHMDWGQGQRSLDKLEARGLLRKEKNPEDRRAYLLYLTDQGQEIFQKSREMTAAWDEEQLAILTDEEQRLLLQLLQKVLKKEQ